MSPSSVLQMGYCLVTCTQTNISYKSYVCIYMYMKRCVLRANSGQLFWPVGPHQHHVWVAALRQPRLTYSRQA